MPSFKPTIQDDVDRIKRDVSHDIKIGKLAAVSLGGMRSAKLRVTGIGQSGATMTDKVGRKYKIRWEHITGPIEGDQPDDAEKAAEPLAKSDALRQHIAAFSRLSRR